VVLPFIQLSHLTNAKESLMKKLEKIILESLAQLVSSGQLSELENNSAISKTICGTIRKVVDTASQDGLLETEDDNTS
jgi:hypothetical protein